MHYHQYLHQLVSIMGFKMEPTGGTIFTSGLSCGFWMSWYVLRPHSYLQGFPAFFLSLAPFQWDRPSLPINHSIYPGPIQSSTFGKPNLNTNILNWFCKRQHLLATVSQFILCLFLSNKNRRHQIFNRNNTLSIVSKGGGAYIIYFLERLIQCMTFKDISVVCFFGN